MQCSYKRGGRLDRLGPDTSGAGGAAMTIVNMGWRDKNTAGMPVN